MSTTSHAVGSHLAARLKAARGRLAGCVVIGGLAAAMPACADPLVYDFSGTIGSGPQEATVTGSFTLDIGEPTTRNNILNLVNGIPATLSIGGQSTAVTLAVYDAATSPVNDTVIFLEFGQNMDDLSFQYALPANVAVVSPLGSFEGASVSIDDGLGGCSLNANCPASFMAPEVATVPEPSSAASFATAVVIGAASIAIRRRRVTFKAK